jgi:enamine deaminase RidA (YjgF/YER057c/UK114 family)
MNVEHLLPAKRLSAASICNGFVHLAGQVASNTALDVEGQTREILSTIDGLLAETGSDKHHLLMVQIFLADVASFSAMNVAWDEWVSQRAAPPRATVEARLADPLCLVEVVVVAAQCA